MSRNMWFLTTLCIVLVLKSEILQVSSLRGCTYKGVNYTECDLMFWTSWAVCDGSNCPGGKQIRMKGVCCPKVGNSTIEETKENCKKDCSLTDADFQETAPYIPPSTTTIYVTTASAKPSTSTLSIPLFTSTPAKPLTSTKAKPKGKVYLEE